MNEFTDPETLRERVEFIDAPPEEHQNHFEMYDSIVGMTIAGVTDDEGRLLILQLADAPHPTMPYGRVDPGDDWVATKRKSVADSTGVEATIDDPIQVRHHTYRSETGEETTGYDVVFAASPENDETDPNASHDWTAAWRDPTTLDLPDDEENDVLNDIRLLLETE